MLNSWKDVLITNVDMVIYVPPETGKNEHNNRAYHGFVLNDSTARRNYYFSDGKVLKTKENDVFYLPKGSSYKVKSITTGGCYAINFVSDICDEPFSIGLKNPEPMRKIFKSLSLVWMARASGFKLSLLKGIYEIILLAMAEEERKYMPSYSEKLIAPAVDFISKHFTSNSLKVSHLAGMCGISEAYFRRLFSDKFGVSPKKYILQLRMDYARSLLECNEMSVSEIAISCGFSEVCHFSREYKKLTGVSPKQECISGI